MNCHTVFSAKYAMNQLGSKFVQQTAKQTIVKELMMQQKSELNTIGDLVTWTQECRKIQKNLRYGLDISYRDEESNTVSKFPPKPQRQNGIGTTLCPCPVNDCRGTISTLHGGQCTICKIHVCTECQMTINIEAAHQCDPNIIETMKELRETTKPCPKCGSRIHKTEGCDHMHCTNCDTHFSWKHLTILMNSSNYHYRNRLVRNTIANEEDTEETGEPTDYCAVSMDDPRIPLSVLQGYIDNGYGDNWPAKNDVLEILYDVTTAVRYLKRTEYSEIEIAKRTRDRYDELQVKYAMNELSEKEWEQQVYKTHIKQQSYELIAGILHIYLANMDGIQSELYNVLRREQRTEQTIKEIVDKIRRLTTTINENIEEIRQEYDPTNTTVLRIRSIGEPDTAYCSKHPVGGKPKKEPSEKAKTAAKNQEPQKNIELYPYQIDHVNRLQGFLQKYHFAIDLSPLGTGKTYSAAKIFTVGVEEKKYKHLVVIAPPSVKTKWIEVVETYSVQSTTLLTYGEITGRKFSNPKCGYIIRNDYKVPVLQENGTVRMIDKYNYKTTQLFETMVEEGVLIVIDEFQQLKNDCAQTEACETLIRSVFQRFNGTMSRVLLMSGSPMDKQEQAVRLYKTLGIMRHDKIVSGLQRAGINEIVDYIHRAFPTGNSRENAYIASTVANHIRFSYDEAGNLLYRQYGYSSIRYAYMIFLNVIKPCASSTMDLSQMQQYASNVQLRKYNGYFHINETHNIERVNQAVAELQEIRNLQARIRFRRSSGGRNREHTEEETGAAIMSQLSRALISIETAKIDTFARLAKSELQKDPNKKVVIGVNYLQTIEDLVEILGEFTPLVINGGKTIACRRTILAKFQAPTTEHRLLIGNISVISTGIDLDDKQGEYPRTCFISPNYHTIHIYQLGHRFLRGIDTRSDTDIYMVYGQNQIERRIMESLMEKGEVMKNVTIEQSRAGVVFPSNYTPFYE
jgi:hypothetical protein